MSTPPSVPRPDEEELVIGDAPQRLPTIAELLMGLVQLSHDPFEFGRSMGRLKRLQAAEGFQRLPLRLCNLADRGSECPIATRADARPAGPQEQW